MSRPPIAGRAAPALASALAAVVGVLAGGGAVPASAQAVSHHTVRGVVVEVDSTRSRFVVSHDSIPGVMAAMTMPFDVRDGKELAGIAPGMIVTFGLVLGKTTVSAEQVRVVPYESVEQDPLTARRLKLLTEMIAKERSKSAAIGEAVPDFTLTDQVRRPVSLARLRGKVVVIGFIYTSCALPQFCFRTSSHFAAVRKRFQARRDLMLLTVTFDPARDTPERLAQYAKQWNAVPDAWHFLTGSVDEVRRAAGLFGIDFFPDEGLVTHSLRTSVIDRQGRLAAAIDGNEYTPTQLGDLVQTVLGR
jgi:protein SCO1